MVVWFTEGDMEFEIKSGIPVPEARQKGGYRYPFAKMEVGDCIDSEVYSAAMTAYQYGSRNGKKFAVRRVLVDGKKVFRIWRTS